MPRCIRLFRLPDFAQFVGSNLKSAIRRQSRRFASHASRSRAHVSELQFSRSLSARSSSPLDQLVVGAGGGTSVNHDLSRPFARLRRL